MNKNALIYVAGHQGLVGSAIVRALQGQGYTNLVVRSFSELDLRDWPATSTFFRDTRPDYVFLAAAKVGGIQANSDFPADFLYDNLMIQTNVLHAAYKYGVKKLLFLGSSCIYPRMCPQPMKEEYLLTGPLEPTNEPYAIAKIAGLKMCQAYNQQHGTTFIAAMPTNVYGPHDTFNELSSHVIPALIQKFHYAKSMNGQKVELWGTGKALREFIFVDDLAHALLILMEQYTENQWINVGTGQEVTIADLAYMIKKIVGFEGDIFFDTRKSDGTPRKLLDSTRLQQLGFAPYVLLEQGLKKTYEWFLVHNAQMSNKLQLSTSGVVVS